MTAWKLIEQLHQSTMGPNRCMCNSAIDEICVDRGRGFCGSANACRSWLVWIGIRQLQRLLWLGDLGHGGLGEEAAALQLPLFLLLQQLAAHQPDDGWVVGEDADHRGAGILVSFAPLPHSIVMAVLH